MNENDNKARENFDKLLNGQYGSFKIASHEFKASDIFKNLDPVGYETVFVLNRENLVTLSGGGWSQIFAELKKVKPLPKIEGYTYDPQDPEGNRYDR